MQVCLSLDEPFYELLWREMAPVSLRIARINVHDILPS